MRSILARCYVRERRERFAPITVEFNLGQESTRSCYLPLSQKSLLCMHVSRRNLRGRPWDIFALYTPILPHPEQPNLVSMLSRGDAVGVQVDLVPVV